MFRDIYIIFLFFLISCNGNSQKLETPKNFLNQVKVDGSQYLKDSTVIIADLYRKMKNHEASFTNPEYFDSTILAIDTIIYDFSLNKIAVFVIAQNPTYRNPYSDSKLPYYYNGSCYLGKRKYDDSVFFEMKQLGPFKLVNFDDAKTIKKAIREYFFLELATVLDEKEQPVFKYNLNDKRFWESPKGWKRMFE